jgi:hypothetical protein
MRANPLFFSKFAGLIFYKLQEYSTRIYGYRNYGNPYYCQ